MWIILPLMEINNINGGNYFNYSDWFQVMIKEMNVDNVYNSAANRN